MVDVKWNGKTMEFGSVETVLILKAQIFDAIEIEIEKQKLIYKGRILTDETKIAELDLKEKDVILLLGSKKAIPNNKAEEQNSNQKKIKDKKKPTGLINLGNTCYINAVVQLLHSIPELVTALKMVNKKECHTALVYELKLLFEAMNNSNGKPLGPFSFVVEVQKTFCQFQEKDETGQFAQQDSLEFWDGIMNLIDVAKDVKEDRLLNRQLFEGRLVADGVQKKIKELFCPITTETKSIENCIEKGLEGFKFEVFPRYLTIKLGRFYWKKEEKTNAKILKKIPFPLVLDVVPFKVKTKKEENVFYSLVGVLTHRGRSTSSGHYIAWIKEKEDRWWMFDDQKVSSCLSSDILKLSGGGDWHVSYLLLYRQELTAQPQHQLV